MKHLGCRASALLLVWLGASSTAEAFELSVGEERTVQVTALATGYGFAALHTVVLAAALSKGKALDRSWVPGTVMSGISLGAIAGGYVVLASEVDDRDRAISYHMSAAPGQVLSGVHLGLAIDGAQRGAGDMWMTTPEAVVSLIHGAALSALGTVLIAGANPGTSDLSKVPPIYTWTVSGALLAGYSVVSLIVD